MFAPDISYPGGNWLFSSMVVLAPLSKVQFAHAED